MESCFFVYLKLILWGINIRIKLCMFFVYIYVKMYIDKFRIIYYRSCIDDKNEKDSMEVDFMVFNIFFVIIGLIVGFGLGFMVVKLCYEKEIVGV